MTSERVKLDFPFDWGSRWQEYYNGLQSTMNEERVQRQREALKTDGTSRPVLFLNHL